LNTICIIIIYCETEKFLAEKKKLEKKAAKHAQCQLQADFYFQQSRVPQNISAGFLNACQTGALSISSRMLNLLEMHDF
jgi:hypothetical protein